MDPRLTCIPENSSSSMQTPLLEGVRHAGDQVYEGVDHSGPAGARGWSGDGGCVPPAPRRQRDVLQVEGSLWRQGRITGAPAEC